MAAQIRRSGIEIIGDAPWGTHFCQFYQTWQDLLDILVPYFKAGLENNEFCMWVTAEPLTAEDARKAIAKAVPGFSDYQAKGQIEILPYTDWYLKGGYFECQRVLSGWVDKLNYGLARGFDGLRLTGNTFWLEKSDWKSFADYEEAVNSIIGKYRIVALCTYSLDKCNALEVIDVIRNHQFAIIKQEGQWERIENSPYTAAKESISRQYATQQAISRVLKEALTCETEGDLGCKCLAIAEELTTSKFGFIGKLSDRGKLDDIAISDPGWEACQIAQPAGHGNLPIGLKIHGIYGRVLQDGKGFFTNDPPSHPDRIGLPAGHPPLTAFLGVPLTSGATIIGMVGLGNREGGYRQEDLEAMEALAPAITQALMWKRADDAFRRSEEKYRNLFESMDEGFALCEMIYDDSGKPVDFRYLSVNPAFARLTGLPVERVIGRTVREVIPGIEPIWIETFGRVARTGQHERIDNPVAELGKHYEVYAWRAGDKRFAVVFNDITEHKQAEEALRHRTADLEAANKELEAFSYSVSHDLRAPLRSMEGFAQALVEDYRDKLDDTGKDYLRRIQASSMLMGRLIDDMLKLSRITRSAIQPVPLDLSELAASVAAECRVQEPGRLAQISIAPGLKAAGDPAMLRIVFQNLLGNAWKFTGKMPETKIEVGAARQDGRTVYFVRDNGVGFDMAYVKQLFRPFQRLHSVEEFPGTGIGLATVQRIIRRHDGEVWAEGAEGRGATFFFTLNQRESKS